MFSSRHISIAMKIRKFLLGKSVMNQIIPAKLSTAAMVTNIPSNLKIADMKVFEKPPEPKLKPMDYLFPSLDVPKTLPIISFNNPDQPTNLTVNLDPRVFGVAIRKDIVLECIRHLRHKRRQPKKTKRMSEIRGSNKKPWPQKGQGRAQVGHKRNSVWRGGQKAHGPVIRDYSIGLNRKVRASGMMIVLAAKLREENLIVVDNFDCKTHKTKALLQALKGIGVVDKSALLVEADEVSKNFELASNNIPRVKAITHTYLNVYEATRADVIVLTASALSVLQSRLMNQYLHGGKRQAYKRKIAEYLEMSKGRPVDNEADSNTPVGSSNYGALDSGESP